MYKKKKGPTVLPFAHIFVILIGTKIRFLFHGVRYDVEAPYTSRHSCSLSSFFVSIYYEEWRAYTSLRFLSFLSQWAFFSPHVWRVRGFGKRGAIIGDLHLGDVLRSRGQMYVCCA